MSNPNPERRGEKPRRKLPKLMEPEARPDERHATSAGGEGYRVLLYNDHTHWMDEVAHQVAKALRCDLETATGITVRAHRNGRAVVTITDKDEARSEERRVGELG